MLTVYVQRNGGPDLLRQALRADDAPHLYVEGIPNDGVLRSAKEVGLGSLRVMLPEQGFHPEDQVWVAHRLAELALDFDVRVATHSLIVLYTFNNAILRLGTLAVEAYSVGRDGAKESIVDPDRWIDERVLGRVAHELMDDLNRLCAVRRPC